MKGVFGVLCLGPLDKNDLEKIQVCPGFGGIVDRRWHAEVATQTQISMLHIAQSSGRFMVSQVALRPRVRSDAIGLSNLPEQDRGIL